ncbi:hypothetical protein RHMOL_Rhmol02G0215900 [Rhododendron molle]|uniref:Uncharacterized protein n=1 Tax=Rhododendron molle TaxID=49168 RepID=A0ACC0PUF8_RHOML|nr:hypothetical protein RHMOL_Rhmol02G0215900 [Rhododendron molle]
MGLKDKIQKVGIQGRYLLVASHLAVTEDKFVECFSLFGRVSEHEIIRDPFGRSRGFGFIVFDGAGVVDTILDRGNKIDMEGTQVEIKRAQPKKKQVPATFPAPFPSLYATFPYYGGFSSDSANREGGMWWRQYS